LDEELIMDITEQSPWREADLTEQTLAKNLVQFLIGWLKDPNGRVRSEELISAAATIVGERCIEAAADLNPRHHNFTPGSRVFSDRVNELLAGNVSSDNLGDVPSASVIGMLRDKLVGQGYQEADFPPLSAVFQGFAARIGHPSDWGRVPLSVPAENLPVFLPLQVAYETRTSVDEVFAPLRRDGARCLHAATLALAEALNAVSQSINHKVAMLLALETVNGMAKTAPMTDEALSQVAGKTDGGDQPTAPPKKKKAGWRFW
jgi:hypothetical protein